MNPEVTDSQPSGEELPSAAFASPHASLRTPALCNPFTLPALSRFSGNTPDDEEAVERF